MKDLTNSPVTLPPNMMLRGRFYHVRTQLNGRDVWRTTGHGVGAEKSAIRRAGEILVELRNNRDWTPTEAAPTLGEWAATYMRTFASKAHYNQRIVDRICGHLGWKHRAMDKFRLSDLQDYFRLLGKTKPPASMHLEYTILKAIWQRAVDDGVLTKNPWNKVDHPKVKDLKPRIRLLTEDNEQLLRKVWAKRPDRQRWLTFMLGTGLRIEESGLVDEDMFDFQAQLISLPGEICKGGFARQVPIFPHVAEALQTQLATKGGLWWRDDAYPRKLLKAAAIDAGIPHLSPHDLRHTFATRYLQKGGDIFVLSLILGHSDVSITQKTYAHLVGLDLVRLSEKVDWTATSGATPQSQPKTGTRQLRFTRK